MRAESPCPCLSFSGSLATLPTLREGPFKKKKNPNQSILEKLQNATLLTTELPESLLQRGQPDTHQGYTRKGQKVWKGRAQDPDP